MLQDESTVFCLFFYNFLNMLYLLLVSNVSEQQNSNLPMRRMSPGFSTLICLDVNNVFFAFKF